MVTVTGCSELCAIAWISRGPDGGLPLILGQRAGSSLSSGLSRWGRRFRDMAGGVQQWYLVKRGETLQGAVACVRRGRKQNARWGVGDAGTYTVGVGVTQLDANRDICRISCGCRTI